MTAATFRSWDGELSALTVLERRGDEVRVRFDESGNEHWLLAIQIDAPAPHSKRLGEE